MKQIKIKIFIFKTLIRKQTSTDLDKLFHRAVHDHQRSANQMHHTVSNWYIGFYDFRDHRSRRVDVVAYYCVTAHEIYKK